MKPLLSPCHGKPIYITLDGRDTMTIWCSYKDCVNTWDNNGNPE